VTTTLTVDGTWLVTWADQKSVRCLITPQLTQRHVPAMFLQRRREACRFARLCRLRIHADSGAGWYTVQPAVHASELALAILYGAIGRRSSIRRLIVTNCTFMIRRSLVGGGTAPI